MNNIRKLRQKRGLKQIEVAEKLKVARTTVTQWETGVNSPRFAMLKPLAKVLKCNINDLL